MPGRSLHWRRSDSELRLTPQNRAFSDRTPELDRMLDLSVVMPAYNEAAGIGTLLDRIRDVLQGQRFAYNVVVVDDGSDDETAEVVRERAAHMPIQLLRLEQNCGYGVALRTGLIHATPLSDVIVTMDADDSHDPALIPEMLKAIELGNDVVIASRMKLGGRVVGVPFHRRLLSDAASLLLRVMMPLGEVRDFTSGYRAYRSSVLKSVIDSRDGVPQLAEKGFVAGLELLSHVRATGARVTEVPLVLRYDRKLSASRMKIAVTSRDVLRLVAASRMGVRGPQSGGHGRARTADRLGAAATAASDLISTMAAFGLAYAIYGWASQAGWVAQPRPELLSFMAMGVVFALLSIAILARGGQYSGRATVLDLRLLQSTARLLVQVATLYLALLFLADRGFGPKALIGLAIALTILAFLLGRRFTWSVVRKWQVGHGRARRILIYGSGETGQLLMKKIMQAPRTGALVVGFIDGLKPVGSTVRCRADHQPTGSLEVPVLGRLDDLTELVEEHHIDELLVTVPLDRADLISDLLARCQGLKVDIGFVPKIGDVRADQLRVEDIATATVLRPYSGSATTSYFVSKRIVDVCLSAFLITVTMPAWAVLAALIRLDSPGPAVFRQQRVGKGGRLFEILKFRTMYADSGIYEMSPITADDPRVTRIGRHVRRAGLDELPQLVNVLRGEMSLVGPRPEMPFVVERYGRFERLRLEATPGITGLWQLSPDRGQEIHANMEYDLYYLRNRSAGLDFLILVETAIFVLKSLSSGAVSRVRRARRLEPRRAKRSPRSVARPETQQVPASNGHYVFVALDQRGRLSESPSWESLIPACVELSQQWPVKLLVAPCNRPRIDEMVTEQADRKRNGDRKLPEYIEYRSTEHARSAAAGATVVVTDLSHVAGWARQSGTGLAQLEQGSVRVVGGLEPTSTEILRVLQGLVPATQA